MGTPTSSDLKCSMLHSAGIYYINFSILLSHSLAKNPLNLVPSVVLLLKVTQCSHFQHYDIEEGPIRIRFTFVSKCYVLIRFTKYQLYEEFNNPQVIFTVFIEIIFKNYKNSHINQIFKVL